MSKFCFTIILLILIPSLAFSKAQDIQFDHFATEDGLSNNNVFCILQDRYGLMWFGTSNGLNRWDGYTFKVFTHDATDSNSISDNTIGSLYEDSSGRIWMGTNFGLNIFDPQTEKFVHNFMNKENSNSLSDNRVNTIFEDSQGIIWIGTEKGLNRYNRQSDNFIRYFFPGQLDSVSFWWNNNTIRAINENKNGTLLLGTSNDFLIFDPKTKEVTTIPYIIPERKRWPQVFSIYKDRLGHFWIAIANDGVIEYNPETGKLRLYQTKADDPFSFNSLYSLSPCEDNKGQIWIGTLDKGLNIFDRATGQFRHYEPTGREDKSLKGYIINSIYKDQKGNMWIGTEHAGINVVPKWKKPFRYYFHDPQNPNSLDRGEVTNFYEDKDGKLWITHLYSAISILDRKTGNFTHLRDDPKNPDDMSPGALFGLYEDKYGDLWLATTPDINRLNRKTGKFTHYRHSLLNPKSHQWGYTLCCHEDSQGTMWFGTMTAGLERFNRRDETFDRFCYDAADSNSISDNLVRSLYLDKAGNFWIGTRNGLCQLVYDSTGKEKFIRYQSNPENPRSITGKLITAMLEDRAGHFWIGTDGGLNLFNQEQKSFKAITMKDGLPSNTIISIVEDDHGLSNGMAGNLWLRTSEGIVKFNPETNKIRIYDERDGLMYSKTTRVNLPAFYKVKSGEIYSGNPNSITVFSPDSLKDNPDPPPIVLTDFKINYEPVKIGPDSPLKKSITFIDMIKLAYDQNFISFEFAALDYTAPKKNLYAYKLEGMNPDWIYTDAAHRIATYTNLHAGKYVFRVKGSNNDGVWNEEGTSVRIIIMPPWWKTLWAYASYVSLFVALVLGIFRFEVNRYKRHAEERLRKEQERRRLEAAEHRAVVAELQAQAAEAQKEIEKEQMRSRIASDLHDEIGSNLSSIALISQMLTQKLKLVEPEKKKLKEIPRIARLTAESMRDIIWFINPENDNMDKLIVKMKQTANLMLEQIDFKFNVPKKGIRIETDLNFRRNLYLIYKEILQNILRHARATQVEISISPVDGYFRLQVIDNGVGFDPSASYPGNGLKNFRRRAEEISGELQIQSQKNEGTTIMLTVKIPGLFNSKK